jgi:hypothetical protein
MAVGRTAVGVEKYSDRFFLGIGEVDSGGYTIRRAELSLTGIESTLQRPSHIDDAPAQHA